MENTTENTTGGGIWRFAKHFEVGEIVKTPALGCWSNGKIVAIEGGYLHCTDPKHGGEFCVHSNRVLKFIA